jgi:hypothetical protein
VLPGAADDDEILHPRNLTSEAEEIPIRLL